MAGRGPAGTGQPLNLPPVFASAFHANGSHGYAREGNPTWEAFEEAIGALEGGHAIAFSSGMASIAVALEELPIGARVLAPHGAYFELRRLLADRVAAGRLEVRAVNATDTDTVVAALDGVDLVWLETLTNPMLDVPELDVIVNAAKRRGIPSIVDATLATPALSARSSWVRTWSCTARASTSEGIRTCCWASRPRVIPRGRDGCAAPVRRWAPSRDPWRRSSGCADYEPCRFAWNERAGRRSSWRAGWSAIRSLRGSTTRGSSPTPIMTGR